MIRINHVTAAAMMAASAALAQPVLTIVPSQGAAFPVPHFIADDGAWIGTFSPGGGVHACAWSPESGFRDVHLHMNLGQWTSSGVVSASGDARSAIIWELRPQDRFEHHWSAEIGRVTPPSVAGQWRMGRVDAIGHDGDTLAGSFAVLPSSETSNGVWTVGAPAPVYLPERYAVIQCLSTDNRIMGGYKSDTQLFRWIPTIDLFQPLNLPARFSVNRMAAMSDDGRTALAFGHVDSVRRGVLWTLRGGAQYFPGTTPQNDFHPLSMAAAGSIAVGVRTDNQAELGPAVWTYMGGLVPLNDFLASRGIDTSAWTSLVATSISRDGTRLCGYGDHASGARGWIVSGLEPARPCTGDYNADHFIDWVDYAEYVNAFERGMAAADLNSDGFVDFFDYADFIQAFETGC